MQFMSLYHIYICTTTLCQVQPKMEAETGDSDVNQL